MEKSVVCVVMCTFTDGAELSITAAVGQNSTNLGRRQLTSTAVLAATAVDPQLRRLGPVAASTAVDVCCRRPRLRSSGATLQTAAALETPPQQQI